MCVYWSIYTTQVMNIVLNGKKVCFIEEIHGLPNLLNGVRFYYLQIPLKHVFFFISVHFQY
jgi:hypothetical protein